MGKNRENWTGQLGFIIAAAASAVGLGNLWRFPASAAKGGGGMFLLIYLVLFFAFGAFLLLTEIAIGRATRLSPIEAYRKLSKRWVILGWLGTVVPFLILPYYCVIGGWVTKFLFQYVFVGSVPDGFFAGFIADVPQNVSFMFNFAVATFVFIFLGVQKGVERSNKVMMPALLFITILMAIFVCSQPGMGAGLRYYLLPNFSTLFDADGFSWRLLGETALTALGQMFFSLSIAMGIMITYGSYVPRAANLPRATLQIGICDTVVAFIAGIVIIPPALAFGGEELATKAGPSLMFVALPKVFATLPCARFAATLFFILVLFAALTSCMSIAETCTASLVDRTGWHRRKAAAVILGYTLVAAVPCACSLTFLDRTDYFVNSILMPIGAFLTCLFIGWVIGPDFICREVTQGGRDRFRLARYYQVLIRYIAPLLVGLIFFGAL